MEIHKITILPTDDKALARKMLINLIEEQPYILMVVLHKGPNAEKFVDRASKLAGAENEPRWVVWVRKVDQIEDILRELKNHDRLPVDLNEAQGFSTSLGDEVRDVILMEDSPPDIVRVMLAYARAERSEN